MLKNILAATAAASLTLAPVAAQAGERASETAVSLETLAAAPDRAAAPIDAEAEATGLEIPLSVLIATAIALGIAINELVTSKGIFH